MEYPQESIVVFACSEYPGLEKIMHISHLTDQVTCVHYKVTGTDTIYRALDQALASPELATTADTVSPSPTAPDG